jgi:hypothetical protein
METSDSYMDNKRKLLLKLLNLHCYITDESGSDEIFLVVNDQKIWPSNRLFCNVRPGCTRIMVDLKEFDAGTSLDIEVWDFDYLSSNDLLGIIRILLDEPGGPYVTDMIQNRNKTDQARYSIEWELDYAL